MELALQPLAPPEPPHPIKADACPICGDPNACAASACGTFEVDCWCASVRIDAAVLARVPEGLRGRACVCRRCAQTPLD